MTGFDANSYTGETLSQRTTHQIGEIIKVDSKDAAEALAQGGNEASGSTQDD